MIDNTCGILYAAFGKKFIDEATLSARSVKAVHPDLKICVATDQTLPSDSPFDVVLKEADLWTLDPNDHFAVMDRQPYYLKVRPMLRTPFSKTIFLDSDTVVGAPINEMFDLLDRFEILTTTTSTAICDYTFEMEEEPFASIPKALGYFNTGVIGFRKSEATEEFLSLWIHHNENTVRGKTVNDQPGFALALWETDVRFHVLPSRFNLISWGPFIIPAGGQATIIHGRNRHLNRFLAHFKPNRAAGVGAFSWKLTLAYYGARFRNALERKIRRIFSRQ